MQEQVETTIQVALESLYRFSLIEMVEYLVLQLELTYLKDLV